MLGNGESSSCLNGRVRPRLATSGGESRSVKDAFVEIESPLSRLPGHQHAQQTFGQSGDHRARAGHVGFELLPQLREFLACRQRRRRYDAVERRWCRRGSWNHQRRADLREPAPLRERRARQGRRPVDRSAGFALVAGPGARPRRRVVADAGCRCPAGFSGGIGSGGARSRAGMTRNQRSRRPARPTRHCVRQSAAERGGRRRARRGRRAGKPRQGGEDLANAGDEMVLVGGRRAAAQRLEREPPEAVFLRAWMREQIRVAMPSQPPCANRIESRELKGVVVSSRPAGRLADVPAGWTSGSSLKALRRSAHAGRRSRAVR